MTIRRDERVAESLTRRLLAAGAVAGPVFVTTFLVEGATRADYDPLRHPVSSLALGPGRWVQVANFCATGAMYVAFAAGLTRSPRSSVRSRVGPWLIGAAGAGMVGSGLFRTDPVSGYPAGTPDVHPGYSSSAAALHDAFAVPTFLGLPAAALVFAGSFLRSGRRGWALCSAGTGLVMLVGFGLSSAAFGQAPALVNLGGLFQRATIITGFAWLTALAVRTGRGATLRGRLR